MRQENENISDNKPSPFFVSLPLDTILSRIPNHSHSVSILAAGELDKVTRNTPTALGSLQLKTLPTTQRDKHAHHQAALPRSAPEECRNQFGDLTMQTGYEYLCFIPAPETATSVNHPDRKTTRRPRFTMMSRAAKRLLRQ
ncbi:hypothetical protein CFAM422_009707 [Trichoderma lentiforme]|uniref:Uncharacterized protein n=1 Tax=Trichoderma lentiforme TaxID=1567552 RepID=A0A9P4XA10_9HYPO|nr:hypothetical protein CFAM422_009707 [Trichoderma lentiforme]